MLKIGSVEIQSNIVTAPLSGCSDLPFRIICRELGARFCFFEMVDAVSLTRKHIKTIEMLKTIPEDSPIGAQLLGIDPDMMLHGAQLILEHAKPALIDINSGCPVKKVVNRGAGAKLLESPALLASIVKKLASALPVPVTVKMRIGYDPKYSLDDTLDLARACEGNGAAALFVHGRLASQKYSGEVNYASIKAVKDAVKIPVIGSGNILNPVLAKKMLDETGCDGVLAARGALCNPWLFREIEHFLKTSVLMEKPSLSERKTDLIRHLLYIKTLKTPRRAGHMGLMRKVALWYVTGFPNAAAVRGNITKTKKYEELVELIERIGE